MSARAVSWTARLRPRFSLRLALGLVALTALALTVWVERFDPVRRWHKNIRDDQEGTRRWDAIENAFRGKVPGLDTSSAIAALADALGDPSFRVRAMAAQGLGRFGTRANAAIPSLVRSLDDEDFTVRWAAVNSLRDVLAPSDPRKGLVVAALTRALGDRRTDVGMAAAVALTFMNEGRPAVPLLTAALRGDPDFHRTGAIYWLGRIGLPDAAPAVSGLLAITREPEMVKDDQFHNRSLQKVYAAEALLQLGETDLALSVLRRAEGSSHAIVRDEAVKVLKRFETKSGRTR